MDQGPVLDLQTSEDRGHPLSALVQLDQEAQGDLGVGGLILQRLQELSLIVCHLRDLLLRGLTCSAEQREAGLPLDELLKLSVPDKAPRFSGVAILESEENVKVGQSD